MPAPVIPDNGKTGFMGAILKAISSGANTATVHLFQNNITPDSSTVIGTFVEATAGGMGSQPTPSATDSGVIPGGIDNWIFGPMTWTATGSGLPQTIYGYWVDFVDPTTGLAAMLWAQRFDTPQALTAAGQPISFILSLAGTQG